MRSSETGSWLWLLAALLVANAALFAMGRSLPVADHGTLPRGSSYAFERWGFTGSGTDALVQNGGLFDDLMARIRRERYALLLGTSESDLYDNLACALNVTRAPVTWVTVAKGGLAPIYASVLIARAAARGTQLPPTLYIVNPIYFTRSHDRLDGGWLSQVARTPGFVTFGDPAVRAHLTEGTVQLLTRRDGAAALGAPFELEAHLAHRLFLRANLRTDLALDDLDVRRCSREAPPEPYDDARNVPLGYRPQDEFLAWRWQVDPPARSANLEGLRSLVRAWGPMRAPLLLLVIPPNRRFYAAAGIPMDEYDRNYRVYYAAIGALATERRGNGAVHVVNLADVMELRGGYRDRMHPNLAGNRAMAGVLIERPEFAAFVADARSFYAADAAAPLH